MKLTILQENLTKAVTLASRFASTRTQLPILGNILLKAEKTKLVVSSTNLEISVSTQVGAKIEEDGELSIPSKVLSEFVGNLPKGSVEIESDKEQLKISTSGFSSKILGMNASDFPKIPVNANKDKSLNLTKGEIFEALPKVVFATSADETRPILTGVLFILEKNNLTLVATDGFRLSRKSIEIKSSSNLRVVIPKGVLNEFGRISEDVTDILFDVEEKEKQVTFGLGDITISSRILEGDYPDFEKIIPKSSTLKVLIDKEEFARSVKLASVFARDASNIVKLKLGKDFVDVSSESGTSGSQNARVDAKVDGDIGKGFEIAFNYRYLEEFLHSVGGEEVSLEFTTPDKAGVFGDTKDAGYLHLIMPVRIQG